MAPDSGFYFGIDLNNFDRKRDSICFYSCNAVSKRVASMGRHRCVSHPVGGHGPALEEAGNNTELFLIVGWTVLALSEINVLYGMGRFSHGLSVMFAVVIGVAALISLVCYVLYYNLGDHAAYFDGMIPLLMVALVAAGISAAMLV